MYLGDIYLEQQFSGVDHIAKQISSLSSKRQLHYSSKQLIQYNKK